MTDEVVPRTEPPSKDGTPDWAYDEDGYCVCCGNGSWKHHTPDCLLRDALDALEGIAHFEVKEGRVVQPAPISACYDDGPFVNGPDGQYVIAHIG